MEEATMDTDKLLEKIFSDKEIRDIPVEYICRVVFSVMEIISKGDIYYDEFCTSKTNTE